MIRVFPRKTKWIPSDDLAFVGKPPPELFLPKDQPVKISVTFTWDIPYAKHLFDLWSFYYTDVEIGGIAFGDPGSEFIPGRFIKEGVTITSRGCPKRCAWCFIPKREGGIRELEIKDNNLLACSRKHIEAVFVMLKRQKKPAEFRGGLDASYLKDWHRQLFDEIRFAELWFACDTPAAMKGIERVSKIMNGIKQKKLRCYVLIGQNGEDPKEAESRMEKIFNMGFSPFSQLYQPEQKKIYSKEWKELNRKWSRPAIYKTYMKGKS